MSGLGGAPEGTGGPSQSLLAAELEAQKRLAEASSRGMYIQYLREHGGSALWCWLRRLSIDVNFDFRRWRNYQKASRNLSLWTPKGILRSDNIRRLFFPDLLMVASISGTVCYYNACLASGALLTLPMECFSVTSAALGLLVTFKTNACYNRFDDGRAQWGLLINESRSLMSRLLTRVPSHRGSSSQHVLCSQRYALKLVRTFPLSLKYHLTEDGCNPHIAIRRDTPEAEIRAATALALRAELQQIWDMHDDGEAELAERIMAADGGNRPLLVLHELGHLNADVFADPSQGALHPVTAAEVDRSLTVLQHVLGRCERILRTPIYTPYTKFTSRFLFLWCTLMPMALYPLLGPLGTTPVTLVMAFFLLGLQDIGSRVEQPFDVLPLWQYCQTVSQSCEQMVRHTERSHQRAPDMAEELFRDVPEERLHSFVDPL